MADSSVNSMHKPGRLLNDIRFWIILLFLLRLYGIMNPPLESAHNWRQTTVTMVARNFLETDNSIFFPRIDIAGNKTGITGMEFPLLNYLIYLFSMVFGYQHWYGRLINLLVSSIGSYYFYLLIKRYFNEKTAFASTFLLLCSIWFAYSRKIMPDTFATSLMLAGLYHGFKYLDPEKEKGLFRDAMLFLLLAALGMLSKLPVAFLGVLFILPFSSTLVPLNRKVTFIFTGLLSIIPPALWYGYWVPYLNSTYGFQHFYMGTGLHQGLVEISHKIPAVLAIFYEDAMKFTGFTAFLLGIILAILRREKRILLILLCAFLSFLIVIGKGGDTFARHSYYIIPFVPVMALLAGYGISLLPPRFFALLIFVVCLEGILNQQHDFMVKPEALAIMNLETDLDIIGPRQDLILINSGEYPSPMYFAHRKGWVDENAKIEDITYLMKLRQQGLKYVVILKKTFGEEILLPLPLMINNENYAVYKVPD